MRTIAIEPRGRNRGYPIVAKLWGKRKMSGRFSVRTAPFSQCFLRRIVEQTHIKRDKNHTVARSCTLETRICSILNVYQPKYNYIQNLLTRPTNAQHIYICYLLQLRFHSVAVVLTIVQTKHIRINIHKRNDTKTQYKQVRLLPKHPHITKQVKITTAQDTRQMK